MSRATAGVTGLAEILLGGFGGGAVPSGSAGKKSPDGRRWIPIDRVEHAPAALIVGALIRLADALDTNVSDLLGAHPARPPGHGRAALHRCSTWCAKRSVDS